MRFPGPEYQPTHSCNVPLNIKVWTLKPVDNDSADVIYIFLWKMLHEAGVFEFEVCHIAEWG